MPTTWTTKEDRILRTSYRTNTMNPWWVLASGILLLLAVIATPSVRLYGIFVLVPVYIISAISWISYTQGCECLIDLNQGTIRFRQITLMNSLHKTPDTEYSMSDVQAVQIMRHLSTGGKTLLGQLQRKDGFSIQILLKNQNVLPLTDQSLGFQESRRYVDQLQNFLGTHIPIVAVG
jgi:hypothetical protein